MYGGPRFEWLNEMVSRESDGVVANGSQNVRDGRFMEQTSK